jgi:hypothetical protein
MFFSQRTPKLSPFQLELYLDGHLNPNPTFEVLGPTAKEPTSFNSHIVPMTLTSLKHIQKGDEVLLFLKKPTPQSSPLLNPKPNPKPFFLCDCCKKFGHKFKDFLDQKHAQIFLNNFFFSKCQIYVHGSSGSYKYIRMFKTFFFSVYG